LSGWITVPNSIRLGWLLAEYFQASENKFSNTIRSNPSLPNLLVTFCGFYRGWPKSTDKKPLTGYHRRKIGIQPALTQKKQ
jgi:hypothetical protein